jgi:hypothetical protein
LPFHTSPCLILLPCLLCLYRLKWIISYFCIFSR